MMATKYFIVLLLVYPTSSYGALTEFMWSQDEVSGVFKNENGSLGIKFISMQSYLQIDTLDNITLVYFSPFREMNKRLARSVHIMDSEYLQHKSSAHSYLDGSVDGNTKKFNDVLKDLLQLKESILLEDASRALGDKGVTGRNTPAVLPFYMFALQVTRSIDSSLHDTTTLPKKVDDATSPSRRKRILLPDCERPVFGPNCKGLCGKGCTCWKWVCGDCCWNMGCYWHDDCCEKFGFSSWSRCTIPTNFSCDSYFYCTEPEQSGYGSGSGSGYLYI